MFFEVIRIVGYVCVQNCALREYTEDRIRLSKTLVHNYKNKNENLNADFFHNDISISESQFQYRNRNLAYTLHLFAFYYVSPDRPFEQKVHGYQIGYFIR
jgi:hypothetical protein